MQKQDLRCGHQEGYLSLNVTTKNVAITNVKRKPWVQSPVNPGIEEIAGVLPTQGPELRWPTL